LKRDIAYAVRSLWAAKKFSTIVVITLALGLGANTAVFSVLNAVVLQPLPYEEPDRLVRVYQSFGDTDNYMPGPAFRAFRDGSTTMDLAPVYTYSTEGADLTDRAQPERVTVMQVGGDYFRIYGVRPILGQPFVRVDERANANLVVISERIWREYLDGRSDAIGQMLSMNGVRQQVVAILPDTFEDPLVPGVELWTPLDLQTPSRNEWGNYYLSVVGRLRPGATLEQAQAELNTIVSQIDSNYGRNRNNVRRWARVTPLQVDTVGTARSLLWMLLGAVGVLLTIACVNVAGLVLARGASRAQELAVRAALGCSRWRLARQLVIESVLLSLAGGVVGFVSARLVTRLLLSAAPESVARVAEASTGSSVVFAFGFIVALLAGLAFGLVPALQHARPNLEGVLRDSGRSSSGGPPHTRFRQALVVSQIALALVLLTGAGLLLRSFQKLSNVNLGLQPANVLTFQVNLPSGRYAEPASRAAFHLAFQDRLAAIPGVRAAGAVSRLPVTGTYHTWGAGRADKPQDPTVPADQRVVEGHFFEALGIRVLSGRTFTRQDGDAPRQVVINERLARTLYGTEDPIGRRLRVSGGEAEIIGVIADVAVGARAATPSTVYHLHRQFAANRNWGLTQVVSSDRPAAQLLDDVRRELRALDPALVLYQPRMLADVIGKGIAQERFALLMIAAYAGLALTIAAVGLYGVLSYSVSRRQREMGIRLALGAPIGSVRALVVREGGLLAIVGVIVGLGGAFAATRALGTLLYGITTKDPLTFAIAAVILVTTALLASWIPARAATRVDPVTVLRGD
jgi:predicted permease